MSLSRERTLWHHRPLRTVSPAGIKIADAISSTPDDHFTTGPHCRVKLSAGGRVGGASGCPTVRAGIVSPARVQLAAPTNSTPDDHFTAAPDCRVTESASGRVGIGRSSRTGRVEISAVAGALKAK